MRITILFTALIFFQIPMFSQFPPGGFGGQSNEIKGKITATLLDSISNQGISYATVILKKAGKDKEVDGVLSDENGRVRFENVKKGDYELYISFLGYNDKIVSGITLTPKKPDANVENIRLSPADYILDQVEIIDQRALIETKVDKIVYNAEQDASISGGDATDVLRKVPTLSVDLDGNVSLRGSQNLQILINGKPSGMFSNNVANALKMFPADQIKSVEVITSPSAKYDSEGSAGIVNIITKKSNIEGVAGSVDLSVGTRQNSLTGNVNAGKGRFGSSLSGNLFYSFPNTSVITSERVVDYGSLGQGIYTTNGATRSNWLGGNASANAFYDFNAFNAINLTASFRGFGNRSDSIPGDPLVSQLVDPSLGVDQEILRTSNSGFTQGGYDLALDYTKKFEDQKDREFVIASQVSGNIQNTFYEVSQRTKQVGQEPETLIFDTENAGTNIEYTLQTDYTHPFQKGRKLEVGAKGVLRELGSSFDQDFRYGQQVLSLYSQYGFVIKKFQFTTGVRYENTQILGLDDIISSIPGIEDAECELSYQNFFPNISISRSLKNFSSVKLSYSKRIQRPSLFYLNPFNNAADPYNVTTGNPLLCPELVDQVEFSYNTFIKGFGIFSSVFYKYIDDPIEAFMFVDGINAVTNYINVERNHSFGLNLFTTKNMNDLTVRGGFNLYTYDAKGIIDDIERVKQAVPFDFFFSGDYAFNENFKADVFAFYRARTQTLQGSATSFWMTGIGFRREFKKSSIGIRIIDPFTGTKSFNNDVGFDGDLAWNSVQGNPFTNVTDFTVPFRSIGINYRYKFGKVDFKERKSKIKNDDLKQGQGQGQGGGQQQGG